MKPFLDENFLLFSKTAETLYHDYAEGLPIYDYHNHLSPKDIAEHRRFRDLTELWLETDHYKWRAMRTCGVDEKYVTGDASPKEKYLAWAAVVPKLVGSPLYHWTHLELQRYFGITETLSPETAESIWTQTRDLLAGDGFDTVSLLQKMNVQALCTTDDPADDLFWHRKIREDDTIPFRVLPSFRPDKYLHAEPEAEAALLAATGEKSVLAALEKSLDFFCENGCRVTDHGFGPFDYGTDPALTERLDFLGAQYAKRDLTMQLHLGAIRNNSPRLWDAFGPDAGADSAGYLTDAEALSSFLGGLEEKEALPATILYCLDPADITKLSTMAGNFAPNVQLGAAWWFNDSLRGIERQLDELMEQSALAASAGMLTDSRSFTSFVRHEYFRRILCQKLAEQVENGLYPNDLETLGALIEDVCFKNAERLL